LRLRNGPFNQLKVVNAESGDLPDFHRECSVTKECSDGLLRAG
jgi:hypothetical protein